MSKDIGEIRRVLKKAKEDCDADPSLKERMREKFFSVLSSHPYSLTLEDFVAAYEDREINPTLPSDPWGGGGAGYWARGATGVPDAKEVQARENIGNNEGSNAPEGDPWGGGGAGRR